MPKRKKFFSQKDYWEALEEFYDSCIRNDCYNMMDNANYFVRENKEYELYAPGVKADLEAIDRRREKESRLSN